VGAGGPLVGAGIPPGLALRGSPLPRIQRIPPAVALRRAAARDLVAEEIEDVLRMRSASPMRLLGCSTGSGRRCGGSPVPYWMSCMPSKPRAWALFTSRITLSGMGARRGAQ
jgi:hypothetical protein